MDDKCISKDVGYKNDSEKARFDLIPATPLIELATLYTFGAKKYSDRNWENGMAWSRLFSAAQRHLWAFWNGEDFDKETGLSHLASAVFSCMGLREFMNTHKNLDDRPSNKVRTSEPEENQSGYIVSHSNISGGPVIIQTGKIF